MAKKTSAAEKIVFLYARIKNPPEDHAAALELQDQVHADTGMRLPWDPNGPGKACDLIYAGNFQRMLDCEDVEILYEHRVQAEVADAGE